MKIVSFAKEEKELVFPGIELETLESIFSCQRLNHWAIVQIVSWNYKEWIISARVSWICQVKTQSAMWTPGWTKERIRVRDCATRASPASTFVNDAGALAPVVFSDQTNFETCKIRRIKAKERPISPNSTPANSMVASVSIENACS